MRRSIPLLLLFIVTLSSCTYFGGKKIRGDRNVVKNDISVNSFNSIDASGGLTIFVSQGSSNSVQVETDENLIEFLDIYTEGETLIVATKRGYNLRPSKDLILHITSPNFKHIDLSGSVDLISKNTISSSSELNIDVSGAGDIKVNVNAPRVVSSISGSGTMTINGITNDFTAEINGSGQVRSFGLVADNTNVQLSGSADAQVTASKLLDISISGSGSVQYKGNPVVKQKVAGSGSVQKVS